MLKKSIRDVKKRNIYQLCETNFILSNFILKHSKIKKFLKFFFLINYSKIYNSKVKAKNRCVFSGRSRSTYSFARISRLFLRENAFINKLPGLQKSYW